MASTYASKRAAMHPRPYLNRAESSYGGTNDLAGLPATLDIKQSPSWLEHVPGYSNLQKNSSYPSGHTTGAYSWGIALAGMIPELAPQIMARTSEAGNNRIVLGVHYPLDIMGGRIGASAQNGQCWHNEFASSIVPASRQLRDYLVSRCAADGHGTTLAACIANTKASGSGGYTNDFLDPVATEPVADQASAVRVYTARLTYTFPQDTAQSGADFMAPRGAADVLRLAYPELHADQRNAILKATALDSGYPLWQSSDGWQRINWARKPCAPASPWISTAMWPRSRPPTKWRLPARVGSMPSTPTRAITRRRIARRVKAVPLRPGDLDHPPCRATTGVDQRSYRYRCNRDCRRNTDGSTQIQELASAVIQPKFSRAAHRCGDTEQHRPDRRARCDCGRAADHCRTEHGCQTIRNHQRGLCRQYESCRRPG